MTSSAWTAGPVGSGVLNGPPPGSARPPSLPLAKQDIQGQAGTKQDSMPKPPLISSGPASYTGLMAPPAAGPPPLPPNLPSKSVPSTSLPPPPPSAVGASPMARNLPVRPAMQSWGRPYSAPRRPPPPPRPMMNGPPGPIPSHQPSSRMYSSPYNANAPPPPTGPAHESMIPSSPSMHGNMGGKYGKSPLPPFRNMTLINNPRPGSAAAQYPRSMSQQSPYMHQQMNVGYQPPVQQQYNPSGIYPGMTALNRPNAMQQPYPATSHESMYPAHHNYAGQYPMQSHAHPSPHDPNAAYHANSIGQMPHAGMGVAQHGPTHADTYSAAPQPPHSGVAMDHGVVASAAPTTASTPNKFSNDGSFLATFLENQKKSDSTAGKEKAAAAAAKKAKEAAKAAVVIPKFAPFQKTLASKKTLAQPSGFKKVSAFTTTSGAFGRAKRSASDAAAKEEEGDVADSSKKAKIEEVESLPATVTSETKTSEPKPTSTPVPESPTPPPAVKEKMANVELEEGTKELIEKTAQYVSRHGENLLEIMKQKNEGNEKFSFLSLDGTSGNIYFKKCLAKSEAEMNMLAKEALKNDLATTAAAAAATSPTVTTSTATAPKVSGVHYRPPLPEPVESESSESLVRQALQARQQAIALAAPSTISKTISGITFSSSVKDESKPTFSTSFSGGSGSGSASSESVSSSSTSVTRKKSRWGQTNTATTTTAPIVSTPPEPIVPPTITSSVASKPPTTRTAAATPHQPKSTPTAIFTKYSDVFVPGMIQVGKRFAWPEDEIIDQHDGTYEHIKRKKEMEETARIASMLTTASENRGAHHVGQYLPQDELEKFEAAVRAAKLGQTVAREHEDHVDAKLDDSNVGYQMLKNAGWAEGAGLGKDGSGIAKPVNRASQRPDKKGLGTDEDGEDVNPNDDEYSIFRKKMMLAYKFRPNPLNNPRRPY